MIPATLFPIEYTKTTFRESVFIFVYCIFEEHLMLRMDKKRNVHRRGGFDVWG